MKEAQLYDKYLEGRHWENHPTQYAERFAQFLKERDFHGMIVDIGCGNGRDASVFRSHGFDVLGIDYSEKEVSLARQMNPGLRFEVQNVEGMNFADNSVPAFFMINVIHYVDKEKAIAEIVRSLQPKGYFLIHFNLKITDRYGHVDYSHPEEQVQDLLRGLRVLHKRLFERLDTRPVAHTHEILELILQKDLT